MWGDGETPARPSPTIGQEINGGFPWLEVNCSLCRTPSSVDLADQPSARYAVHLPEGRLDFKKCKKAKWKGRGRLGAVGAVAQVRRGAASFAVN
jgi:hypothetical protein